MYLEGKLAGDRGLVTERDAVPEREPDMHRALSRQSSVVTELSEICQVLAKRLGGVMRLESPNESPNKEGSSKLTEAPKVPLVQALDENTEIVYRTNMYLSDIINRLEV